MSRPLNSSSSIAFLLFVGIQTRFSIIFFIVESKLINTLLWLARLRIMLDVRELIKRGTAFYWTRYFPTCKFLICSIWEYINKGILIRFNSWYKAQSVVWATHIMWKIHYKISGNPFSFFHFSFLARPTKL
jgi:hypothetical protein